MCNIAHHVKVHRNKPIFFKKAKTAMNIGDQGIHFKKWPVDTFCHLPYVKRHYLQSVALSYKTNP